MRPWSSPRNSGWRATDWIIEPKMTPMPGPAPAAPRPMPSASAIALPASTTSPVVSPTRLIIGSRLSIRWFSLVFGLDRRADVDGGQGGEDERLDGDHDHDLEDVEDERRRQTEEPPRRRVDDEDESDHREDQDVAGQHVRVETDGQADQAHELRDDLDRDDQGKERPGHLRDPRSEVLDRAVVTDPLDVLEDPREERQRQRHRDGRGRRIDAPDRNAVIGLAG